jgi:hypothetical protein
VTAWFLIFLLRLVFFISQPMTQKRELLPYLSLHEERDASLGEELGWPLINVVGESALCRHSSLKGTKWQTWAPSYLRVCVCVCVCV